MWLNYMGYELSYMTKVRKTQPYHIHLKLCPLIRTDDYWKEDKLIEYELEGVALAENLKK
jgi:hypothetical protein